MWYSGDVSLSYQDVVLLHQRHATINLAPKDSDKEFLVNVTEALMSDPKVARKRLLDARAELDQIAKMLDTEGVDGGVEDLPVLKAKIAMLRSDLKQDPRLDLATTFCERVLKIDLLDGKKPFPLTPTALADSDIPDKLLELILVRLNEESVVGNAST